MKKWITIDFCECIECGYELEVLTDSEDSELVFEEDEFRCTSCCHEGIVIVDDNGEAHCI